MTPERGNSLWSISLRVKNFSSSQSTFTANKSLKFLSIVFTSLGKVRKRLKEFHGYVLQRAKRKTKRHSLNKNSWVYPLPFPWAIFPFFNNFHPLSLPLLSKHSSHANVAQSPFLSSGRSWEQGLVQFGHSRQSAISSVVPWVDYAPLLVRRHLFLTGSHGQRTKGK